MASEPLADAPDRREDRAHPSEASPEDPVAALHRLQLELQAKDAALRLARAQLRSLEEAVPFGLALHDCDLRYVEINRALARIHGVPVEQHLGKTPAEVVPRLAPVIEPLLRNVLGGDGPIRDHALVWNVDGERSWSCDVVPIADEGGALLGVSVTVRDVTERKRREETLRTIVAEQDATRRELEQSREALAAAHHDRDAFLATLGHELRNPLAAIRNVAGLLKTLGRLDERISRAQAVLDRQSAHMARLVDGLLDLSRLTRGKIRIDPQPLDLGALLRDLVDDRTHTFVRRRLDLRLGLPDHEVWVQGDRVRLVQVFDNLLGNALKFTPPGGTVTVVLSRTEGRAVVSVRDTGCGIEPQLLDGIFEPFWQASAVRGGETEGLGLGLALARALVELHGGSIVARSDGAGTGMEVSVSLLLSPFPRPTRTHAGVRSIPLHLLVVEDNADAAETLGELLKLAGHAVDVVYNAEAALQVLRARLFDAILCDIGLPGEMNGYALARAVRADPRRASTILVAITGYGQPADREKARRAGFDVHLTKPVDLAAIEAVLRRTSTRHR